MLWRLKDAEELMKERASQEHVRCLLEEIETKIKGELETVSINTKNFCRAEIQARKLSCEEQSSELGRKIKQN